MLQQRTQLGQTQTTIGLCHYQTTSTGNRFDRYDNPAPNYQLGTPHPAPCQGSQPPETRAMDGCSRPDALPSRLKSRNRPTERWVLSSVTRRREGRDDASPRLAATVHSHGL